MPGPWPQPPSFSGPFLQTLGPFSSGRSSCLIPALYLLIIKCLCLLSQRKQGPPSLDVFSCSCNLLVLSLSLPLLPSHFVFFTLKFVESTAYSRLPLFPASHLYLNLLQFGLDTGHGLAPVIFSGFTVSEGLNPTRDLSPRILWVTTPGMA